MNHADGLLAGVLERPDDPAPWMMLSDWLEEQGDPDSLIRAELLRLQTEWIAARGDPRRQQQLQQRAGAIVAEQPHLIGAFRPILDGSFSVLSAPAALAMFLLADQTSVVDGPLAAGTTWEGELKQTRDTFLKVRAVLHSFTKEAKVLVEELRGPLDGLVI